MKTLQNVLVIIAVIVVLGAMTQMGSDKSSWDCPGEQTPCEVSE